MTVTSIAVEHGITAEAADHDGSATATVTLEAALVSPLGAVIMLTPEQAAQRLGLDAERGPRLIQALRVTRQGPLRVPCKILEFSLE